MSSVTRPSGPLPPKVYWVRRLLVLLVVAAVAYGLLRAFSGADQPAGASGHPAQPDGPKQPQTQQPGAGTSTDRPGHAGEVGKGKHRPGRAQPGGDRRGDGKGKGKGGGGGGKAEKVVRLAEPDGPCEPAEVLVQPLVSAGNQAGDPVEIRLLMRTAGRPACTLSVGPDSLQVKVMSGEELIWTSQECPAAVFPTDLVVREEQPATYRVPWSGTRSAPGCPPRTPPVEPGSYLAAAAVIGGEPGETVFELEHPAKRRPAPSAERDDAD